MKRTNPKKTEESYRADVFQYAAERYGTQPEYLWQSSPDHAVLRHADNHKWYGLLLSISREKLGLKRKGNVDIIELKCDPELSGSLCTADGILPAYHMKKGSWITVLLDGSVEKETVFSLLDMSFDLTAQRKKGGSVLLGKEEWVVPANPKYYDLQKALSENPEILWKQTNNLAVGDIVYLYVTSPVCAILYRCEVLEVNIPFHYDNGKIHMTRAMRLKKVEEYAPTFLTRDRMREHGICAVRSPRRMPDSLVRELAVESKPGV